MDVIVLLWGTLLGSLWNSRNYNDESLTLREFELFRNILIHCLWNFSKQHWSIYTKYTQKRVYSPSPHPLPCRDGNHHCQCIYVWCIPLNSLTLICQWEHGYIIILSSNWEKRKYSTYFSKFDIFWLKPPKISNIFSHMQKISGKFAQTHLGSDANFWSSHLTGMHVELLPGCFYSNHVNAWVEQFCSSKRTKQLASTNIL